MLIPGVSKIFIFIVIKVVIWCATEIFTLEIKVFQMKVYRFKSAHFIYGCWCCWFMILRGRGFSGEMEGIFLYANFGNTKDTIFKVEYID